VAGAREHFVELRFADPVARAVAGLAQIQELFESDQLLFASDQPRGVQPAWKLPASSKVISSFWNPERGEPPQSCPLSTVSMFQSLTMAMAIQ
jgi:hypothetical protein